MKILVIDDHDGFRNEVVSVLRNNGHEVRDVETAAAAIPLVERGDFDFVLVDYNMPVHDGIWFMKHVDKPGHTKILLMTAQENMHVSLTMIKAGGDGYIIKPFDEEKLLRHLNYYARKPEHLGLS
jgi:two-component system chemotaxis response regulator CheY